MQQNYTYFSLSRLSGILLGIYGILAVYVVHVLTDSYGAGFDGASQLPISFLEIGIAILVVITILISLLTLWMRAKRLARKNNEKIWSPLSKKLRFHTLLPIFILVFVLIFIGNKGYYSLITPLILFFFSLILINLSRFSSQRLIMIAVAEIILAIIAFLISDKELLFLFLGFGLFPILYGIFTFSKTKKAIIK